MRNTALAIGVVVGLGTVSLLAGLLRHTGQASAPQTLTSDHTNASIVACTSPGICTIIPPAASNQPLPVLPWRVAIDEPSIAAMATFAPMDLVLTDQLPPNELITLPGRDAPIPRYRAQRYFCPGDFNRDDVIDDKDTSDYLEASATMSGPLAEFLDINHDGTVDASDLQALIDATSADCDPAQTAINRSIICLADTQDQEAFARALFFVDDGC